MLNVCVCVAVGVHVSIFQLSNHHETESYLVGSFSKRLKSSPPGRRVQ